MRAITLTSRTGAGDTRAVYVNADRVAYFKGTPDGYESYLYFENDLILRVVEEPEQIVQKLEDNRSAVRAEERDGLSAAAVLA